MHVSKVQDFWNFALSPMSLEQDQAKQCMAWSCSKLFGTLIYSWKNLLKTLILLKNQETVINAKSQWKQFFFLNIWIEHTVNSEDPD